MLFPRLGTIDAQQAVEKTFSQLRQDYSVLHISMTNHPYLGCQGGALARIAYDPYDEHRQRSGYMIYSSVDVCFFGENFWILGFGLKGGSYPGRQYSRDLMAFPIDANLIPWNPKPEELLDFAAIISSRNAYFRSSILIAMRDGRLVIAGDHNFSKSVNGYISNFVISKKPRAGIQVGKGRVSLDDACTYDRRFPRFLAGEIASYLANSKPITALA